MNFQDILNEINKAMGGTGERSSNNSNGGNRKRAPNFKLFGTVIFLAILGFIGYNSVFMVDQTEQSVVTFFGKYNRTEGPGLHIKIPFVEKSNNVPTEIIQNESFGFRTAKADVVSQRSRGDYSYESTMLTGDLNIVDVEWIIQYRISDPRSWLFNVQDPLKTIRDISISVVNQLVGDYYITDVLGDARTEIETNALEEMNKIYNSYDIGVSVNAVRLQNIVPPEGSVQDAFEDVNKAVQDMNRLINEGREEYNKQIPKSRGQAAQMIEQAQGYATERVNEAKGDVARFKLVLDEYRRNPQITRNRLYYETLETILDKNNSTGETQFVDSQFDNLMPFLQLSNRGIQNLGPSQ